MVDQARAQNGDFDHVLDEVSDDEDHGEDVNMEDSEEQHDNAASHRAPPENNNNRNGRDMEDEPRLEGYQRYVKRACIAVSMDTISVITHYYTLILISTGRT